MPSIALRTARRSVTSPPVRSISRSERWSRLDPRRSSTRSAVAALGERADHVRAQEAGASGDEGLTHEQPDGRAVIEGAGARRCAHGRSHRHDGLSAGRADRRARHPSGQPLRCARGRAAARDRDRRIRVRELLRAPAPKRRGGDHLAAVRGRLHRRLRAAAGRGKGHRLDSPLGRDLGNLRVGRAGPAAPAGRGQGRREDPCLRQPHQRRRHGARGAGRRRAPPAAGPAARTRWRPRSDAARRWRCGS